MSTTEATRTQTRYRFAGSDGTVWLGLRAAPLLTLAATLTIIVACLYLGAPLLVAPVVLLLGLVAALVPVAGRAGVDWAAPLGHHLAAGAGRHWSAGGPAELTVGGPHHRCQPVQLPREYGKLKVLDVGDGALGVIDDPQARTVTAVFAVAGTDRFVLLDPDDRNARLNGWGSALAALAADPQIHKSQWVERAGPDQRDRSDWALGRAATSGTARSTQALIDYHQMTSDLLARSVRHEAWLAVQLTAPCTDRKTDLSAVAERVRDIAGTLLTADLLARPLPTADIAWLLRRFADHTATDPAVVASGQTGGPSSRRAAWSELRTDDTFHRTFAVTGWPRVPVTAGWLEPLLATASPSATRTVSVHLQPVAPALAAREARAARARAQLDGADRSRLGFTDSAATAWAEADATGTEEELIAGYRLHRVSAVLTCSAATVTDLDDSCRAVRAAATTARLDLRPLHGHHDLGFLATLPLCRDKGTAR